MRINIVKSKNSEQIYIIKSFRHQGKNTSKIHKKLGTMKDLLPLHHNSREEVLAWANAQALELTHLDKEDSNDISLLYSPSKQIDLNHPVLFNGGYLFLQDIFYDLKLHSICDTITKKYKFDFDLTAILSRLIYTRILYPSSKLSSFEASKHFLEQPNFDLHQIYRALDVIAKETPWIQSEVYKNSLHLVDRNTKILYYDCTNYFFEIEQEEGIKQYGVSKEHRPNPIVQMGLFMDGNGFPLAFCIHPGNQNEQGSLKPLEQQMIQDFNLSKFVVCTDSGLGSKENRLFNNFKNRSYIVTQSLKKLKKHCIDWSLDPHGWHRKGSKAEFNLEDLIFEDELQNVYYKERWIHENGLEQRLIVTYSPKYKAYQRHIRQGQIQRATKMMESHQKLDKKKANDPHRFIHQTHTTDNGEIAENEILELNEKGIEKEERFDGFYGVCTTLEDSVEDIVSINQRRWEIEESFRIMKTEFKARPVFLKKDERITAHFTTCFLALLLYRILEKKLEEKYTTTQIITELKGMNFCEVLGEGYIPVYTRTDFTDSLHEISTFRTDSQIVSNKKMKKIIKLTKS